jgi:hypothetical protein
VTRTGRSQPGSPTAIRGQPRVEGPVRIRTIEPAGAAIAADGPIVFTWESVGADLYRVTILTENGEPIWSQETPDTSVVVSDRTSLSSGATYFWRVDVVGGSIVASTGANPFVISP